LTDAVLDPVKSHIDRLRFFGTNSGIGKANSTFIVAKNGSRGLGVTEVGQNLPLVYAELGVGIGGGIFCLRYGTDYYWYKGGVT
jgi:hypothetical protein